jgi:hypothetical protein
MTLPRLRRTLFIVSITSLASMMPGPAVAQAPPSAPTTAVLVNLTIKVNVDRSGVMKVMPDEVRATVQPYLDGKIQQWFSRGDGRGVLFIMNCGTVAEAKGLMESLPLSKAGLADLDYTALGPLTPLRALIATPGVEPPKNDR